MNDVRLDVLSCGLVYDQRWTGLCTIWFYALAIGVRAWARHLSLSTSCHLVSYLESLLHRDEKGLFSTYLYDRDML